MKLLQCRVLQHDSTHSTNDKESSGSNSSSRTSDSRKSTYDPVASDARANVSGSSSIIARSSSLTHQQQDHGQFEAAKTQLLQHVKAEGDHWVLVRCGDWEDHPLGWKGPAWGLLQMWRLGDTQDFDYIVHAVDPVGIPTGKQYNSLRGGSLRRQFVGRCSGSFMVPLTSHQSVHDGGHSCVAKSSWGITSSASVSSRTYVGPMK
jgi:hypothetical protein